MKTHCLIMLENYIQILLSEDIAKYNIETVLLRFESRIKIEMCLYYLYYLHENESN